MHYHLDLFISVIVLIIVIVGGEDFRYLFLELGFNFFLVICSGHLK